MMANTDYRNMIADALMEWCQNSTANISREECYALTLDGLSGVTRGSLNLSQSAIDANTNKVKDITYKSNSSHCR